MADFQFAEMDMRAGRIGRAAIPDGTEVARGMLRHAPANLEVNSGSCFFTRP